jgi:catechol 2,3-dioxygenase-like lactoylglutathione lyase family enzyme
MSDSLRVECIDHITLVVGDLERSRAFYVDLLGMEEVERPAFSFAGAWFRAGNTLIHLILEHDESGPAGIFVPAGYSQSRTHHFAFIVSDAREAESFLLERGISLISSARLRPDGWVQVFLNDPDGHVVELCSAPK